MTDSLLDSISAPDARSYGWRRNLSFSTDAGHFIRQGTYLELLPTPLHDFKATTEWLKDELFEQPHSNGVKQAVKAAGTVGGVVIGAIGARKLINALRTDHDR